MKLAISANNKKRKSNFDYSLDIPDYVVISVAAMMTGIAITKTVMKRKERKTGWYSRIFK